MPEVGSNVELAHKIHEHGHQHASGPGDRRIRLAEILEALVLAIVAVTTAWSGYQAARWDALSMEHYALSTTTIAQAQEKMTLAGQDRLLDITTFNGWIYARETGDRKLMDFYQRRFRPEYMVAFNAWEKLDVKDHATAPPGPTFMPEYRSASADAAKALTAQSGEHFNTAVSARETGDDYIRLTVFLATALLLTAIGQRFHNLGPRVALLCVAFALVAVSTYWVWTLPRL
jgi:hypothetical protein